MSSEWIEFAKAALTGLCANDCIGLNPEADIADMACLQVNAMMIAVARQDERTVEL